MKEDQHKYFIIDFDSTFIKTESLEELAWYVLRNKPNREETLKQIESLTKAGMEGKIGFGESLEKRLKLLQFNKKDLEEVIKILKRKITSSFARNKKFFRQYKDSIYIITGGFKEWVEPVVCDFGISEDHILANSFIFDTKGVYKRYDTTNVLSHKNGKAKAVAGLKLEGEVIVIGDGYTDYEIKQKVPASKFVAFTENIYRENVVKGADEVVFNLDEFLYAHKLPMSVSFPKNRIKVLLLENISHNAVTKFEKEGYRVEWYEKSLTEEELKNKIKDIHILGIRSRTNVPQSIIQSSAHLYSVGAFCIGTDKVDLIAAADAGVAVFNAPYSNTRSVVELALGEIIMLMRKTFEKSNHLHYGVWDKSAKQSNEIRGKTLGIIGYGNIGSQLSVLAESLGMRVLFYDIVEKLALGNARRCRNLKELLTKSDIITVHVDGRKENKHLIGDKEFRMMRKGVVFLNLSRGFIVDIQALAKYLKNGTLRGAGVDVFPKEPKGKDEPFVSMLQNLPNVILTPHVGGSTIEAQDNIGLFVADKIIEFMNTGSTYLSVNMPMIQLPKQVNSHRMLHMHQNVPGILAQINQVFANYDINVIGQYLKTNEEIGYVITDVNKKYDDKVVKELRQVEGTIRLRVLY